MAEPVPLRRTISRVRALAVEGGARSERPDVLAAEEPMEIRVQNPDGTTTAVAVTMRTPGGDFELAVGFLYTEGLVERSNDVRRVSYCEDLEPDEQHYNVVTVELSRALDLGVLRRNFFANSSCGICGKATLDEVEVHCAPLAPGPEVDAEAILAMPHALRRAQRVFEQTGGLHAAGLFSPGAELLALREDVGRHNAVDKIVGERLLAGDLPLGERVLQVSGRIGFEIVQKAARAGIPLVSAVGAPSSLAVDAAERLGMTLVGFVRDGRFNVYSHADRIRAPAGAGSGPAAE
ncbi:MAG: formate dehydrogenase accessory sulfurtransferase FdhD [Actinomycetota bacterium]